MVLFIQFLLAFAILNPKFSFAHEKIYIVRCTITQPQCIYRIVGSRAEKEGGRSHAVGKIGLRQQETCILSNGKTWSSVNYLPLQKVVRNIFGSRNKAESVCQTALNQEANGLDECGSL